jgi:hypothetical protein
VKWILDGINQIRRWGPMRIHGVLFKIRINMGLSDKGYKFQFSTPKIEE